MRVYKCALSLSLALSGLIILKDLSFVCWNYPQLSELMNPRRKLLLTPRRVMAPVIPGQVTAAAGPLRGFHAQLRLWGGWMRPPPACPPAILPRLQLFLTHKHPSSPKATLTKSMFPPQSDVPPHHLPITQMPPTPPNSGLYYFN